ncbi:MAG: HmuY family protein [Bacteroidales bacterium]|nr:HmuY family protein [Bacteroidales bacterium]
MKYLNDKISSRIFIFMMLVITSVSCMDKLEEDEKMETLPIPEGIKVGSVELGSQYLFNAYYDLGSNKVVQSGTNFDYDLAFEASADGWHILLNSALFMTAGNTLTKNFDEVTSQAGLDMNFDPSTGNLDSTAVGRWFEVNGNDTVFHQNVYVIDLGLDETGISMGYKKVVFEKLSPGVYTVRHANLDGTEDFTTSIPKDPTVGFVGFTFNNGGGVVNYQPQTPDWDLFFGQYTTLLFAGDEPYPYLVRGVITNRAGVRATLYEGEKSFSDFEYSDALGIVFTDALDGIGHDWKYYNLEEGFYSVRAENTYIIRNAGGDFYKLHFLSYFNSEGETGYPQFEFKKLNP